MKLAGSGGMMDSELFHFFLQIEQVIPIFGLDQMRIYGEEMPSFTSLLWRRILGVEELGSPYVKYLIQRSLLSTLFRQPSKSGCS